MIYELSFTLLDLAALFPSFYLQIFEHVKGVLSIAFSTSVGFGAFYLFIGFQILCLILRFVFCLLPNPYPDTDRRPRPQKAGRDRHPFPRLLIWAEP